MADKNVIGISFGVLGKGAISGDSGARILKQLKEIVEAINKKPDRFKIKFSVDKAYFKKQINALAKQINAQSYNIKISNNIGAGGAGNKQVVAVKDTKNANKAITALLKEQYAQERKLLSVRRCGSDVLREQTKIAQEAVNKFEAAFENAKNSGSISGDEINQISVLNSKLEEKLSLQKTISANQDLGLETKFKGAQAAAASLLNRYQDLIRHNQLAAGWANKLNESIAQPFANSAEQVREFVNLTREADMSLNQLAVATNTFGSKLRQMFDRRIFITLSVLLVGTMMRAVRQVYRNVAEFDSAMTNLRVTTRASKREFEDFSRSASASARRVGASINELVEATTVFARLGHSLNQAQELAEQAIIYSRITGESIEDIAGTLSNAIQVFGLSTNDLENILDHFVHIGRNFKITSQQISRAIDDAATTLAKSGNTLSESLGILGAATIALQNESNAANAVRHISARMSRDQAELRNLGIDAGDVMSTQRLASRMQNFGVAIKDANGNLRSTFAILNDVSKVWDSLGDSQRNAIATMIAGDSQSNAFKSIMENWNEANDIVDGYADGLGSMRRAQEQYMNSIEARVNQLQASWTDFSQALLDTGVVKTFLSIMSGVANALTAVMSFGDGFVIMTGMLMAGVTVAMMAFNKLKSYIAGTIASQKLHTLATNENTAALAKNALAIQTAAMAKGERITSEAALTQALQEQAAVQGKTLTLSEAQAQANQMLSATNKQLAMTTMKAVAAKAKLFAKFALLALAMRVFRDGANRTTQATGAIVAGIIAVGVAILLLRAKIKAFKLSNPIGWILLLVSAIITATTAIINLFRRPSVQEMTDAARDARDAFEELTSELDNVNTKLDEVAKRIREIEELSRRRPLNLVEEDELNRLRALNGELIATQRELEIRATAAQAVAQSTATIAANAQMDRRRRAPREIRRRANRNIRDADGTRIDLRTEVNANGDTVRRTHLDRIGIIMDNWDSANVAQRAFVADVISDLAEHADMISYVSGALTREQQDANEVYRRIWEQRDRLVLADGGGLSDIWGSLLSRGNFSSAVNELRIFADAGEVTAESLEKLISNNSQIQGFIDYIERLGYALRDEDGFIHSFIVSINELWNSSLFRVGRLDHLDIIEETQSSFDALARGLEDISRVGVLSAQSTRALIEEYEQLAKFFQRTSQGFVLSDEFAGLTQTEVLQAFATESLKQYVAVLEVARRQVAETAGEHEKYSRAWHEHRRAIEYAYNAYSNLNIATETWAIHLRAVAIRDATTALNEQRDALRDQLSAYRDLINIRRDLLRTYRQEINFQRELSRRQQTVADIQTQLAMSRMDTSASGRARTRELESQLQQAQEALDDFTLERAVDVLTRQLDNQFREYELLINAEVDRIVDEIENLAEMLQVIIDRPATDTAGVENQISIIGKQGQLDAVNRRIEQQDSRLEEAKLQEALAQQNLASALNSKHGDVDAAEEALRVAEDAMREARADMAGLEAKRTGLENQLSSLRTEPVGSVDSATLQRNALQAQIDAAREEAQRQENIRNLARTDASSAQSAVDSAGKHDDTTALGRERDAANRVYNSAQQDLDNLNAHLRELEARMKSLPKFHTGGVINTNRSVPGMRNDELLAILQNGEGVLTRHHMRNLSNLIDTNRFLLRGGSNSSQTVSGDTFNFEFKVGTVTREALPQTEKIIKEAVNRFKQEIGSSMTRAGHKSVINKFRK